MGVEHTPGSIFGSITSDWAAKMADLGPSAPDEQNLLVPPDVKIIGRLGDFDIFDVRHGGMGQVYLCVSDKDEQRRPVAFKSFNLNSNLTQLLAEPFNASARCGPSPASSPVLSPCMG
jgi:hypothetical protein